jgi:hypothetical protein
MLFNPALGSGAYSEPGADVTKPIPAPSPFPTGTGLPMAPGKVGTVMSADLGTELVLAKLTLAAQTDLLYGQCYQLDKDYNCSLLTTAAAVGQEEIGFNQCFAPATPSGTYYLWLARSGHIGVQIAAGSAAAGQLESTTTAGQLKAPASPTVGSKAVTPGSLYATSASFTANTTNGSPTLTGISSINDVAIGASLAGAGIPANAIIQNIRRQGGSWAVDMVSSAALTTPLAATATATAVPITVTGVLNCCVYWPTLAKTN